MRTITTKRAAAGDALREFGLALAGACGSRYTPAPRSEQVETRATDEAIAAIARGKLVRELTHNKPKLTGRLGVPASPRGWRKALAQ
jgi:hypothetical protein